MARKFGRDETGHEERHIDRGMSAPQIDTDVRRKAIDRGLGRTVRRPRCRHRHSGQKRRHIDDVSPPALHEVRHDRLHSIKNRLHIDRDHLVDVFIGQRQDGTNDPAAGVVNPHIHVTEHPNRFVAYSLHIAAAGDISRDDVRAPVRRSGHRFLEPFAAPRRQHQTVAAARQLARDRCTYAPACACYDDVAIHGVSLTSGLPPLLCH